MNEESLYRVIYNCHSKLISDLEWILFPDPTQFLKNPENDQLADFSVPYLATCSYDGYLKIWSMDDVIPVYEFFSSQVTIFS